MTASEKLAALEAQVEGPQSYMPMEAISREWEDSANALINALPQLRALVEAAERYVDKTKLQPGVTTAPIPVADEYAAMGAALAALGKALGE